MNRKLLAAMAALGVFLAGALITAQTDSRSILVTLARPAEPVAASEFEVRVGNKPAQIVTVYQPDERPLRLALLIDDSAGSTLISNLAELRQFLEGLPPGSIVQVAYKHGGALKVEQPFTADLAAAVAALSVPARTSAEGDLGGTLAELLDQFPDHFPERGQILYLGEGTGFVGEAHHDPTLARTIRRAQERGVVVWTLHVGSELPQSPGVDSHLDREAYLDRLSRETGGEALALGLHPPSLLPHLRELRAFFDRQYLVEFQPPPGTAGKKLVVKVSGGRQTALHPDR